MPKPKKTAKQHKDTVNKARRERYAAKHGGKAILKQHGIKLIEPAADSATDKREADYKRRTKIDSKPPTEKGDAATAIVMLSVDRGTIPLETVSADLTDAEIIAAALATGQVRYNDILFIVNANNSRATRTLIVLK